jgi:hypothetical protein
LIAEHTREGKLRDELVREVADRLDVRDHDVRRAFGAPAAARPAPVPVREPGPAYPEGVSAGEVAFRAEREFFADCLASGDLGRRYLSEPTDDQLTSDVTRRARDHLARHFDDPIADLPESEPALGRLVHEVVHTAARKPPSEETILRMSILQLERRRLEREIRRAEHAGDHARKSDLAAALQGVRTQLDTGIGQTV